MKKPNPSPSFKSAIGGKFSRRKFLTAAGASALALPFIKPASVIASCGNCPDVNNIPKPNPYLIRGCNEDIVCDYNAAGITVTGIRRYGGTNQKLSAFPCRDDYASICYTIYPNVSDLLAGDWDNTLGILLGQATPRDMMSCWHELAGGKKDASNHLITATDAVNMQNYILNFRARNYPNSSMAFGAIECGNGNSGGGWNYVKPYMAANLDFYGNDLYYVHYNDPAAALNDWLAGAVTSGHSPNATIAVCECNCPSCGPDCDPSDPWKYGGLGYKRPCYFTTTANWLWNQPNRGPRSFLTYWNPTGTLSGPWHADDTATINALANIGNGDYTITGC